MKLYIDRDSNPSSSLRNGYLTSGQKSLDPVFYGDVLKLDIHLVNELGELLVDRDLHSVSFLITDGTSNLISTQTLNYNGLSFSSNVDFGTSEMQTFLDGVEERNAIVEIQDIKNGTTKTIFQGSIKLRNRFSVFQDITLNDPIAPTLISVFEVLAPLNPSLVDAETTPQNPSSLSLNISPIEPSSISVSEIASSLPSSPSAVNVSLVIGTIPANPSNISIDNSPANPSLITTNTTAIAPSSLSVGRLANVPSNLTITSTPNAPTETIFSDYLLPWTWNGSQVYVPQAYVFEGTQDFAVLNDKVFVWDGLTLENGAPVYECSGSNCQTHATGGIERIYASSVTATTISWNLYFRNTNQSIYQTSGIGFTEENFSFYETTITGTLGSIKFLPTNVSLPDVPSLVTAEKFALPPSLVNAVEVSYSQDPFFDVTQFNGYGETIILLQQYYLRGDDPKFYPAGSILRTIGISPNSYPIRVEDPAFPRVTPYTTGANQNTGSWGWAYEIDRGIKWEFVDLNQYNLDLQARAVEEADLQVSGITDVTSLNGAYQQRTLDTAIQDSSLNYVFSNQEQGEFALYLGYWYKKILNSDCTLTTDEIYLFKSYRLDSNGNEYTNLQDGIRWSFATTHPLYMNTLNPQNYSQAELLAEAGILKDITPSGTGAGDSDPFNESFATELTSGSSCETKPSRPTNVSATI